MADPPRPEMRDENLRLIYAREEKQAIDEGLRRAKGRVVIGVGPIVLVYGAAAGVLVAAGNSEPSMLDLAGIALVIASIVLTFAMLANLTIGMREYRRYRRYREEHSEFLEKYGRLGYGDGDERSGAD